MSADGVCFRARLLHFFLKHNLSDFLLSFLCAVLWGSEAPLLYLRHGWGVSSLSLYEEDVIKFVLQAGLAREDPHYWMARDGRDWEQEEKRTTEDEMAGWHHRLNGREFE